MIRSSLFWTLTVGTLASLGCPDGAKAQVAFAPGIATVPDGIGMTVVPAVSADRRYVRVSVDATFQTVDGFTNANIPFAVSGLGTGQSAGALLGGAGLGGALGGAGQGGSGLRSVGLAMGMDGPARTAASVGTNPLGYSALTPQGVATGMTTDSGYYEDDWSWTPPRRAKATSKKSTRAKKPATAPAATTAPARSPR